jgi:hypothetical protein
MNMILKLVMDLTTLKKSILNKTYQNIRLVNLKRFFLIKIINIFSDKNIYLLKHNKYIII